MTGPSEPGPNSQDVENEHRQPSRPHLCSACSQIDFKVLFTSHERPILERDHDPDVVILCNCADILEAHAKHLRGWPSPESANESKPRCCFCEFCNACLLRSKDIALRSQRDPGRFTKGPLLKGCHSLMDVPIEHGCEFFQGPDCQYHHVQDVYALQFTGERMFLGLSTRLREHTPLSFLPMDHAILRVLDSSDDFPGLVRGRSAGGGLLARKIIPHQVNYSLISDWLRFCRLGHAECNIDADVVMVPGFQVIDCTTMSILSAVNVLASGGVLGPIEYVTLSYVWGHGGFNGPVLREDTHFLPDDLPLVISDALEVVRRLGHRYLWIDRYCIPQNDPSAKEIQIKSMETIFSCSVLTIIAAAGDGPDYGLPGVSSRLRVEQLVVEVDEGICLVFYDKPSVLFAASKWNTRGWTYQEGLLSKRRLVFTDEMIYFQCQEMHGDEVLSLPIPDLADPFDDFRYLSFQKTGRRWLSPDFGCIFPLRNTNEWSNLRTIWDRISQFAQRQLAFDEDTLNAIAGIFGKYVSLNSSKPKGEEVSFFCGLPITPLRVQPQLRVDKWSTKPMQKVWLEFAGQSMSLPHCQSDDAESAGINVEANLTYRLVNSLLWHDDWEAVLDELNAKPTSRENHLRKGVYPSWTWAGWKSCSIYRERFVKDEIYDSCTTVHVEFEHEEGLIERLHWDRDNERIQYLSQQENKMPLCLVIKGTVMDMKLTWDEGTDDDEEPADWVVTSPPFAEGLGLSAPRCLFNNVELEVTNDGDSQYPECDKEVDVLGLTLSAAHSCSANCVTKGHYYKMRVMILRPVTRFLRGQPITMYERAQLFSGFDTHEVYFSREETQSWPPIASFFRETTVRIC